MKKIEDTNATISLKNASEIDLKNINNNKKTTEKQTENEIKKADKQAGNIVSRLISKVPPTYIYALGGLGEVGKNMYIVEQGNEIWIMDSGIKFASDTVAADGIIPSFEWLIRNQKRIKGLIITHGHEDHIGAVPHLLNAVRIPKLYAGKIAIGLINSKLRERGVPRPKIEVINNKTVIRSLNFKIDFFAVNHSIPDCYGVRFVSKHGTIINTADFKFDLSPVGSRADIAKMGQIGTEGVTLLLSDSTNSLSETFSKSEMDVRFALDKVIKNAQGRIIIATFASNVYRVREIIALAEKHKRKVVIFGYSMDKVIDIARRIKYINVPDSVFVKNSKEVKNMKDRDVLIISTGTQGETNAALSKMSDGRHKEVKIRKEDTVVFASSAIPGNYEGVEKVTNRLIKKQCTVINNKTNPNIHASGHGGKQEQLLMLSLLKPTFFFPIHGETAMQITHAKTALTTGIALNKTFILKNGQRLKMEHENVVSDGSVPADDVFVDDTNLKGQSMKVIGDRNRMAKNGIATVTIQIMSTENRIINGPFLETKGIFHQESNRDLILEIERKIKSSLETYYRSKNKISFSGLKEIIRTIGENEIFKLRRVNPIVLPIILNYSQEMHKKVLIENMKKPKEKET